MKPAALALALSMAAGIGPGVEALQRAPDNGPFALLSQWISAVERHDPGEADAALLAVAAWSGQDLQQLWIDVQVLIDVVENPKHKKFTVRPPEYETFVGGRNARTVSLEKDEREVLDNLAKRVREAGFNVVLRRAVLLHTDSVVLAADLVTASGGPRSSRAPVKMLVGDGNSAGLENVSLHWEMGRLLGRAVTPDPKADVFVRDWYRATVALFQSAESFDADQLRHGLRLFPDDPRLLFLAGCEREAFASPLFQAFARSVSSNWSQRVSIGRVLRAPFGSEGNELDAAERYYRRALEVDPTYEEARVRLGRVLARRGRHAEAATELQRAIDDGLDQTLEYYAILFLGEVREALGQLEAAQAAYRRATELTPGARVPHLQLARVARELGDVETVQASLKRALAVPDEQAVEPWLSYRAIQGRQAAEQLDQVRRSWGDRPQ